MYERLDDISKLVSESTIVIIQSAPRIDHWQSVPFTSEALVTRNSCICKCLSLPDLWSYSKECHFCLHKLNVVSKFADFLQVTLCPLPCNSVGQWNVEAATGQFLNTYIFPQPLPSLWALVKPQEDMDSDPTLLLYSSQTPTAELSGTSPFICYTPLLLLPSNVTLLSCRLTLPTFGSN